jgi:hypothetical protein
MGNSVLQVDVLLPLCYDGQVRKELPQPHDSFEFTRNEELFYRVTHQRFLNLLADKETRIHDIELSYNNYGEFLFVTLSRPKGDTHDWVTFFGLGFHEMRDRYLFEEWFWYRTHTYSKEGHQVISKEEAQERIRQRLEDIQPYLHRTQQSERGKWFDVIADLMDEDGAAAEFEDLQDFFDSYE